MRKLWCVNKENVDLLAYADHLEKTIGVQLTHNANNVIHGALYANHFPAGKKEHPNENKGTYWCNDALGEEEHTCIVLVLYEQKKQPTYITGQKSKQMVTLTAHPQLQAVHTNIEQHITDFCTRQGEKVCWHDAEELKEHLNSFVPAP